jgi:hypothetical protein
MRLCLGPVLRLRAQTSLCKHRSDKCARCDPLLARRSAVEPALPVGHIGAMSEKLNDQPATDAKQPAEKPPEPPVRPKEIAKEIGGPKGPEPTRYGDWEVGGRCTDF